jgi:hypothetical protein
MSAQLTSQVKRFPTTPIFQRGGSTRRSAWRSEVSPRFRCHCATVPTIQCQRIVWCRTDRRLVGAPLQEGLPLIFPTVFGPPTGSHTVPTHAFLATSRVSCRRRRSSSFPAACPPCCDPSPPKGSARRSQRRDLRRGRGEKASILPTLKPPGRNPHPTPTPHWEVGWGRGFPHLQYFPSLQVGKVGRTSNEAVTYCRLHRWRNDIVLKQRFSRARTLPQNPCRRGELDAPPSRARAHCASQTSRHRFVPRPAAQRESEIGPQGVVFRTVQLRRGDAGHAPSSNVDVKPPSVGVNVNIAIDGKNIPATVTQSFRPPTATTGG